MGSDGLTRREELVNGLALLATYIEKRRDKTYEEPAGLSAYNPGADLRIQLLAPPALVLMGFAGRVVQPKLGCYRTRRERYQELDYETVTDLIFQKNR